MNATVVLPGTIARPRPRTATGSTMRHRPRAQALATVIALAAAILAAAAGGVIDGAADKRPADPLPQPLPGPAIVL